MSNTLFTQAGVQSLNHILNRTTDPEALVFENIIGVLGESGLGTRVMPSGIHPQADIDDAFSSIGGAETTYNLHTLNQWLDYLRQSADLITRGLFKERMLPYVQHDNRSVVAALARTNSHDSIQGMLGFMTSFVHKDIKHPIRMLPQMGNNSSTIHVTDYNHTLNTELTYTEEETGTYHTLLSAEHPADRVKTYSVYLEDTPLVRRYLRYIDRLSIRHGIRLVYCPKSFNHLEEIDMVARPSWTCVDDRIIRTHRGERYRALYVSLAFVYDAFSSFTRVETEVQPNQAIRNAGGMIYQPVLVEYIDAFVQVLKQLGVFSVCKIYYKGSRMPERL